MVEVEEEGAGVGAGYKRGAGAGASAPAGKKARTSPPLASSHSCAALGLRIHFLDGKEPPPSPLPPLTVTRVPCPPFTHVFSHVTHRVSVERWDVVGTGAGALTWCGQASPSTLTWASLPSCDALGLTTWTVKALHAALWAQGRPLHGQMEDAPTAAAWKALSARAKKAGCAT